VSIDQEFRRDVVLVTRKREERLRQITEDQLLIGPLERTNEVQHVRYAIETPVVDHRRESSRCRKGVLQGGSSWQ